MAACCVDRAAGRVRRMSSAIFSATIMVGKLVLAQGTTGKIEASTTRKSVHATHPARGIGHRHRIVAAPMRQEQEQCQTPTAASLDVGLQRLVIVECLNSPADSMTKLRITNWRRNAGPSINELRRCG